MCNKQSVTWSRAVFLLACAPLFGEQYTISTVAGDGVADTVLHYPTAVAVDQSGNVYFGDWTGTIRKLWAIGGAVTTVAGTGVTGFSGDGGQAITAMLGKIGPIALDASGNVFIVDGENNRIRRVDASTGIITTVAGNGVAIDSGDGGLAVSAGVAQPTGITVDREGDLYFSNWSRVRKLNARTGTIETFAGGFFTAFSGDNGPALDARFWDPIPFAVSRAGDLYIVDFENSRIRMVTAKTGIVTPIIGTGPCPVAPVLPSVPVCQGGFGGDGGPAKDATLNHAEAAAFDAEGNLYIADTINHRIRRVDKATGIIYTIAGNGVSGFSGDGGPALAAEMTFPAGIAVDGSGRVYFADENNHRIRLLTPTGPRPHRFVGEVRGEAR
jgi:trimeric autotransporter adhesin